MTLRRRNLIRHQPDQWASEHERARFLSALRLSEPLEGEDAPWLEAHLETCEPCAVVAVEYAAEQSMLRALPMAEPPRDLWARTQTALEAERRRGGASTPGSSRPGRVVLVPIMASLAVAFSVISFSFLSSPTAPGPTGAPPATMAPIASVLVAATPLAVAAADVAWVKRSGEGTYDLIVAPVTEVCDTAVRPDCPPLSEPVEQTIALPEEPQAVLRSPTDPSLVIVETRSASGIGGVYVVAPATAGPTVDPSALPTPEPTPPLASEPPASVEPSLLPTPQATPEPTPAPSPVQSLEPSGAPTPSTAPTPATPLPSASGETAAVPIATDVVLTGAAPAFSSDGTWLAFSARPADGSYGSDIYVWRPGEPAARALTVDHRAYFSSWVDGSIIASRVIPVGPDPLNPEPTATDAPAGEEPGSQPASSLAPTPQPATSAPGDAFLGNTVVTVSDRLRVRSQPWVGDDSVKFEPLLPLGTELRVLDGPASGSGYVWYLVEPIAFSLSDGPGYGWVAMAGKDGEPWIALAEPSPEPSPTEVPVATPAASASPAPIIGLPQTIIFDPATGMEAVMPADGIWRPVLDPQRRIAVFWRGTLMFDAEGRDWHPNEGRLVVATWSPLEGLLPGQVPEGEQGAGASPTPGPTGSPAAEPTATPTHEATAAPVAGSSGSPAPDASVTPTSSPGPSLPPFPMPIDVLSLTAGPLSDWDVHWSGSGSHVALWLGDPLTPSLGLLSLYRVDPASGVPLLGSPLLAGVPAGDGFSLSDDRLAWASLPGQGGEGSRLLVLAWEGDAAGQVESQPSSEESPVLVVR